MTMCGVDSDSLAGANAVTEPTKRSLVGWEHRLGSIDLTFPGHEVWRRISWLVYGALQTRTIELTFYSQVSPGLYHLLSLPVDGVLSSCPIIRGGVRGLWLLFQAVLNWEIQKTGKVGQRNRPGAPGLFL